MSIRRSQILLLLFCLIASPAQAQSLLDLMKSLQNNTGQGRTDRSSSEVVVVLAADGLTMTQFVGTRTGDNLSLLSEPGSKPSDLLYFFPPNVRIEPYDRDNIAWQIPPGGYSSMNSWSYPEAGSPPNFLRNRNGSFTYKSWDGKSYDNGGRNYGHWLTSGFKHFALSWIVPSNVEIISYESNADQRGRWRYREPVLSYMGDNVNNFTYSVTYRVRQSEIIEAQTLP